MGAPNEVGAPPLGDHAAPQPDLAAADPVPGRFEQRVARSMAVADRRARRDARANAQDLARRQRMGRSPGPSFCAVVLVAMGAFLVGASTPTIDFSYFNGWPTIVLLVTFLIWLARMAERKHALPSTSWRTHPIWYFVPPIAGLLMVVLIAADVPFHTRWAHAQPEFAAVARTAPTDDWQRIPRGRIAGFPISEVHRDGGDVWFRYTGQSGFMDFHTRYIAYLPDGPDVDRGLDQGDHHCSCQEVTSLGDGWYYLHDNAD